METVVRFYTSSPEEYQAHWWRLDLVALDLLRPDDKVFSGRFNDLSSRQLQPVNLQVSCDLRQEPVQQPEIAACNADDRRDSRFLSEHPKVSRFIARIAPALCPFLPLPTDVQGPRPGAVLPRTPAPRPRASRFVP